MCIRDRLNTACARWRQRFSPRFVTFDICFLLGEPRFLFHTCTQNFCKQVESSFPCRTSFIFLFFCFYSWTLFSFFNLQFHVSISARNIRICKCELLGSVSLVLTGPLETKTANQTLTCGLIQLCFAPIRPSRLTGRELLIRISYVCFESRFTLYALTYLL